MALIVLRSDLNPPRCRSCCCLSYTFYFSSVAVRFGFSSSLSVFELALYLSHMKTSIVISPSAPTCHESAVIETLIIPHKPMHG